MLTFSSQNITELKGWVQYGWMVSCFDKTLLPTCESPSSHSQEKWCLLCILILPAHHASGQYRKWRWILDPKTCIMKLARATENPHLASTTMRLFRTPSAHDLPRPCRSPELLQTQGGTLRVDTDSTSPRLPQAFRDSDFLPFFWQKWNDFEPFFCYFSWTSAYVNLQLRQLGPSKTCLLPTCSLVFYSAWSPTDSFLAYFDAGFLFANGDETRSRI